MRSIIATMTNIDNKTHLLTTKDLIGSILDGTIMMFSLVGSRNLEIHTEESDYDYVCLYLSNSKEPNNDILIYPNDNTEVRLVDLRGIDVRALTMSACTGFQSSYKYCSDEFKIALGHVEDFQKKNVYTMYKYLIKQLGRPDDGVTRLRRIYSDTRDCLRFLAYQESSYEDYNSIMESSLLPFLVGMKKDTVSIDFAEGVLRHTLKSIKVPEHSEVNTNHPFLVECRKLVDKSK